MSNYYVRVYSSSEYEVDYAPRFALVQLDLEFKLHVRRVLEKLQAAGLPGTEVCSISLYSFTEHVIWLSSLPGEEDDEVDELENRLWDEERVPAPSSSKEHEQLEAEGIDMTLLHIAPMFKPEQQPRVWFEVSGKHSGIVYETVDLGSLLDLSELELLSLAKKEG